MYVLVPEYSPDAVKSLRTTAPLTCDAEVTLARMGYNNVSVIVGEGGHGLPHIAPQIPTSLFDQLRDGGRMVIPAGPAQAQELQPVSKQDGRSVVQSLDGGWFVSAGRDILRLRGNCAYTHVIC